MARVRPGVGVARVPGGRRGGSDGRDPLMRRAVPGLFSAPFSSPSAWSWRQRICRPAGPWSGPADLLDPGAAMFSGEPRSAPSLSSAPSVPSVPSGLRTARPPPAGDARRAEAPSPTAVSGPTRCGAHPGLPPPAPPAFSPPAGRVPLLPPEPPGPRRAVLAPWAVLGGFPGPPGLHRGLWRPRRARWAGLTLRSGPALFSGPPAVFEPLIYKSASPRERERERDVVSIYIGGVFSERGVFWLNYRIAE